MPFLKSVCLLALSALHIALNKDLSSDECNKLFIIGGHRIYIEDVPYMVALFRHSGEKFKPFCGGSIIHDRFVLTAAHCAYGLNMKPSKVLVGSDQISAGGIFIDIEKAYCHPGYELNSLYVKNDICLLKLKEPIQFGCRAAKAQLPDEDLELEAGTLVNVTGWGWANMKEYAMVNDLRQVAVPMVSEKCCARKYYHLNVTTICAGSRGHDSCKGDSGGPMTYNGVQIGVVSYGKMCAIYPGVYTRVASYLDWINSTITNNLP